MANQKSTYLQNALLNHVLRGNVGGTAYTPPAAIYLALYTVAPTASGGGTEVSGGAYARQLVTFTAPLSGAVDSALVASFPRSTAAWGIITSFGLFDASTAGNLLWFGTITPGPFTIGDSQQVDFEAGSLIVIGG